MKCKCSTVRQAALNRLDSCSVDKNSKEYKECLELWAKAGSMRAISEELLERSREINKKANSLFIKTITRWEAL